ncbi:hypothetical protein JW978_03330 [Candidatus Dojkabacteria bacterium]|nr:hypothetical protein [Candidatus Dojkabacteria bacterium]
MSSSFLGEENVPSNNPEITSTEEQAQPTEGTPDNLGKALARIAGSPRTRQGNFGPGLRAELSQRSTSKPIVESRTPAKPDDPQDQEGDSKYEPEQEISSAPETNQQEETGDALNEGITGIPETSEETAETGGDQKDINEMIESTWNEETTANEILNFVRETEDQDLLKVPVETRTQLRRIMHKAARKALENSDRNELVSLILLGHRYSEEYGTSDYRGFWKEALKKLFPKQDEKQNDQESSSGILEEILNDSELTILDFAILHGVINQMARDRMARPESEINLDMEQVNILFLNKIEQDINKLANPSEGIEESDKLIINRMIDKIRYEIELQPDLDYDTTLGYLRALAKLHEAVIGDETRETIKTIYRLINKTEAEIDRRNTVI